MNVTFKDFANDTILKTWELNSSQERFWKSNKKYILFSGGFGCGKSLMLVLKAIHLCLKYPGNYILMGRRTYPELRDSLLKEFNGTCPDELIKSFLKAEMRVIFNNKSEIIFRHLDTIAESEIRSLNLGGVFIDQAEDIPKDVFLALVGRMRRETVPDIDRKIYLSSNPKLTWLYADFKQNPGVDYDLIEASTLDNEKHLPKSYVEGLMKYPDSWKRQYVYGIWDLSLLSDNTVFAREHVGKLLNCEKTPIETREGLDIYKRFSPWHRYQMGIDSAEGGPLGDEAAITIVDLDECEEVASWSGRLEPDVVADKAEQFAEWYQDRDYGITIIPEMNSVGLALVNRLKGKDGLRIYRRQEFDKVTGGLTEKLGWRTTTSTKPLLVSRFQELLRYKEPKIYSGKTLAQLKSFIYTNEAKKSGMGAQEGFHDDRVISALLAFWQKGEVRPGTVTSTKEENRPILNIVGGKLHPDFRDVWLKPKIKKWTT